MEAETNNVGAREIVILLAIPPFSRYSNEASVPMNFLDGLFGSEVKILVSTVVLESRLMLLTNQS